LAISPFPFARSFLPPQICAAAITHSPAFNNTRRVIAITNEKVQILVRGDDIKRVNKRRPRSRTYCGRKLLSVCALNRGETASARTYLIDTRHNWVNTAHTSPATVSPKGAWPLIFL
jgi:hypothetical protein